MDKKNQKKGITVKKERMFSDGNKKILRSKRFGANKKRDEELKKESNQLSDKIAESSKQYIEKKDKIPSNSLKTFVEVHDLYQQKDIVNEKRKYKIIDIEKGEVQVGKDSRRKSL